MYQSILRAALWTTLTFACSCASGGEPATPSAPAAKGAAVVVELFTSEGCSSCPPADRELGRIVKETMEDHRPIFALAWHVDYWNRLGWADPYSSADASARQTKYGDALKLDEIYTPQMIVNGQREFLGSDAGKMNAAIADALSHSAIADISLTDGKVEGNVVTVTYTAKNAPAGAVLEIVAAERGLTMRVLRGENGGRALTHENVVRANQTIPLRDHLVGQARLTLPLGVDANHVTLIAFVQDPQTMAISGAASSALVATASAAAR